MALNRSDKSRILRRYFSGMTRNSEMSTEPSQLLDHVEALEARISELEGRQKPPTEGGKERKPPSWAKANRPDRPKKERRNRAHGFARRQEEPTHRVEHAHRVEYATASCPDCGTLLLGGRVRGGRQIISIPRVRARVTEHVVLERTCRKCGQRWSPEPDWSALVVGRQRVGISLQQEVCVLREECRLPYGVIQRYLKWRYRLCLSVGKLVALVRGVARLGQEEYNRLQQRFEPVRWCMGTKQAGGKLAATGISGASAIRKCVTSSAGAAGAAKWLRRCWGMSLTGCWSVTSGQ